LGFSFETKIILSRFMLILAQIAACVFLGWAALELQTHQHEDRLSSLVIDELCEMRER
jgi:hypothetical protein